MIADHLCLGGRLSKIRSVHTYVMIRTVHFNWICTFQNLMLFAANQRDHLLLYSQDTTSCDYDKKGSIFALSLYYVIQKKFIERDRRTNNKYYSVVDFWDISFQVDRRSMILKNFSTKRQKWPYRFFVSYEGWVILVNQCMKIEKISNFCSKQSHPSISKRKSPAHSSETQCPPFWLLIKCRIRVTRYIHAKWCISILKGQKSNFFCKKITFENFEDVSFSGCEEHCWER